MSLPEFGKLELIGVGANAQVYAGVDRDHDRPVAIKIIQPGPDSDAVQRRFDRERRALGRLSQVPNVVDIYQSGMTDDGEPYLVMPQLPSSFAELVDSGPVGWLEAARLMQLVASAIASAHEMGVLHLDLKPSNVLLDASGDPQVSDFGIAEFVGADASRSGVMLTPDYSPPERFDDEDPNVSMDVYALGACLFALLTGGPPFSDGRTTSPAAAMKRIIQDPVPIDRLPDETPDELVALVERTLAKEPDARPTSARGFAASLERIVGSNKPSRDSPPGRARETIPFVEVLDDRTDASRPAWGWIAAALALVLVAVGAIAVATRSDSNATDTAETEQPPAASEDPDSTTEPVPSTTTPAATAPANGPAVDDQPADLDTIVELEPEFISVPPPFPLEQILPTDDGFVAVSRDADLDVTRIMVSTDGRDWSQRATFPFLHTWLHVYGDTWTLSGSVPAERKASFFARPGDRAFVAVSIDAGISWREFELGEELQFAHAISDDSRTLILGDKSPPNFETLARELDLIGENERLLMARSGEALVLAADGVTRIDTTPQDLGVRSFDGLTFGSADWRLEVRDMAGMPVGGVREGDADINPTFIREVGGRLYRLEDRKQQLGALELNDNRFVETTRELPTAEVGGFLIFTDTGPGGFEPIRYRLVGADGLEKDVPLPGNLLGVEWAQSGDRPLLGWWESQTFDTLALENAELVKDGVTFSWSDELRVKIIDAKGETILDGADMWNYPVQESLSSGVMVDWQNTWWIFDVETGEILTSATWDERRNAFDRAGEISFSGDQYLTTIGDDGQWYGIDLSQLGSQPFASVLNGTTLLVHSLDANPAALFRAEVPELSAGDSG